MRRATIFLILAALLAACGTPEPAPTSPPPRIAFTSYRDGNYEIYVMNADGTGQVNLTNNPAEDDEPAWSPDGKRIAFISDRDGKTEIYVMNADGTGQTNLTGDPAEDGMLAWSPDGARIAFVSYRDGNAEIYIMPVPGPQAQVNAAPLEVGTGGSGLTRLTNNPAGDWGPAWSPDGTRIAFVSDRDGSLEIYVMDADGTDLTNLTDNPAEDQNPNWSPDGSRIAFDSNRDGNGQIYVVNAASLEGGAGGTGLIRLTDNPGGVSPIWSRDGKRIAFMRSHDGKADIYVISATPLEGGVGGTGPTRLTDNPAHDTYPAWSPDGSRIVFESQRDGNWEIYVMDAAPPEGGTGGTGQTCLTTNPARDIEPAWSP